MEKAFEVISDLRVVREVEFIGLRFYPKLWASALLREDLIVLDKKIPDIALLFPLGVYRSVEDMVSL